jgi:hypothetical protein
MLSNMVLNFLMLIVGHNHVLIYFDLMLILDSATHDKYQLPQLNHDVKEERQGQASS